MSLSCDPVIEEISESIKKAEERLARAEDDLVKARARLRNAEENYDNLIYHPDDKDSRITYELMEKEINSHRKTVAEFSSRVKDAEYTLVELSKLTLQHLSVLNNTLTPSIHTSEHRQEKKVSQEAITEKEKTKVECVQFYYGQSQYKTIRDMLTNEEFPIHIVHCSPIYKDSWGKDTFEELKEGLVGEQRNITMDSPQNMLLLHEHVEQKYDSGQLLFEYDDASDSFMCRILDKSIVNIPIFLEPRRVTFGDYDNQPLHFPLDSRPLSRLVRFRATGNRFTAAQRGIWVLTNSLIWSVGRVGRQRPTRASLIGSPRYLKIGTL